MTFFLAFCISYFKSKLSSLVNLYFYILYTTYWKLYSYYLLGFTRIHRNFPVNLWFNFLFKFSFEIKTGDIQSFFLSYQFVYRKDKLLFLLGFFILFPKFYSCFCLAFYRFLDWEVFWICHFSSWFSNWFKVLDFPFAFLE